MGLLAALGLPPLKVTPSAAPRKPGPGPGEKPKAPPDGKLVGPVVDVDNAFSFPTGPVIDPASIPVPRPRPKTIAKVESTTDAAAAPVAVPPPAAPVPAATRAAAPATGVPTTREVGYGDFSLGLKESDDGKSLSVKYERKQNVGRQNFKVWVIPCYVKADLKVGIEGEISLADSAKRSLKVGAAGTVEVGVLGYTSEVLTVGPNGVAKLSASTSVPTRLSEARDLAIAPFVIDIYGTGTVGIKIEIENGPMRSAEAELANWHLFVVHVGTYVNGGFASVRVEPGKDMQRLIAAMENAGPAIADAVDKYAPDSVKKLAEDGARWAAEDKKSKQIADATHKILEELKKKTGVDVGGGVEKSVQFLVDPEGETSNEVTERVRREMVAFNASYDDYKTVMAASGLDTELVPPYRTSEEYNAIVNVWSREAEQVAKGGSASGAWRPMIVALVIKARTQKATMEAAKAQAYAKKKETAESAAAAELAQRVKQSEARMNAMLQEANGVGTPLKKAAEAASNKRAFEYWQTGMMKYWQKGQTAMGDAKNLQGDARIVKADEAATLFGKARVVFQEGRRLL